MSKDDVNRGPSHIAYSVREGEDGKAYFNRIGAQWPNKDGEGYNLQLDSLPIDGRVTLRTPKERVDDAKSGKRSDDRRDNRRYRDEGPQFER